MTKLVQGEVGGRSMAYRHAVLALAAVSLLSVAWAAPVSEWERVWDGAYLELSEGETLRQGTCVDVGDVDPATPVVRALSEADGLKLKAVATVSGTVDRKVEEEFGYGGATFLCRGIVRLFADAARYESCTTASPGKLCADVLESEQGTRDWGRCLQLIRFGKVMRSGLMSMKGEGCSVAYTQATVDAAQVYWDGPTLSPSPLEQFAQLLQRIIRKGDTSEEVKEFLKAGPGLAKQIAQQTDDEVNTIGQRWTLFFDGLASSASGGPVWKKAAAFLGGTVGASRGACCACGPRYSQGDASALPLCNAPRVNGAFFHKPKTGATQVIVKGQFAPVAKEKLEVDYVVAGRNVKAQGCSLHWVGHGMEEVRCDVAGDHAATDALKSVVVRGGDQGCELETHRFMVPEKPAPSKPAPSKPAEGEPTASSPATGTP